MWRRVPWLLATCRAAAASAERTSALVGTSMAQVGCEIGPDAGPSWADGDGHYGSDGSDAEPGQRGRGGPPGVSSPGDGLEQLLALLLTQPADATVVVDACLLHHGGGLRRAVAGHGLDDLGDLRLLGDVVGLREHLRNARLPGLHGGQQLAALLASSLGLGQRLGALLRGKCWESHVTPSVDSINCPTYPMSAAVGANVSAPSVVYWRPCWSATC